MDMEREYLKNCNLHTQQTMNLPRNADPSEISVPEGYQVEVFAQGLNSPIGMVFTENGDILIADAGLATGIPKVLRLSNGKFEEIANGFKTPITGINYRNGEIYISHRGTITIIRTNGTREDIISGLPSYGDFINNQVVFSQDEKIYFGQGTATNSGVVGLDNEWVSNHPYFHDYPGYYILVKGQNFVTRNILIPAMDDAYTGAFCPFGVANLRDVKLIEGSLLAAGSVYKANLDGSELELVAWGFRNPFQMKFDHNNQLYVVNQGFDNRGSRPIANGPDELYLLKPGEWYGWPDYAGGEPVTQPRFTPEGGPQPELLLESIPSVPQRPFAVFPPDSNVMGFDFNYNPDFGPVGDAYIAKLGRIEYAASPEVIRSGVGHRITRVNMKTGEIVTFAINKTGFPAYSSQEGGLGRPSDIVFGPDGAMYVTDLALAVDLGAYRFLPNTGVIWRISHVALRNR